MKYEKVFNDFLNIVREAVSKVYPIISNNEGNVVLNKKDDGDVTRNIDILVESFIKEKLINLKLPIRLISEECGTFDVSNAPDFILFLDPIDGTDMAARGYPLSSIALSFHEIDTMETIFSIVADIFQNKYYCSYNNEAYVLKNNKKSKLSCAAYKPIQESLLVCYSAKPQRLMKLFDKRTLFENVGLFFNYGGPLDIARVGEGTVDAYLEFQKGFKPIDFVAGMDIVEKAGGIVTDLKGNKIVISRELEIRQKFLASSCSKLHNEILELYNS